MSETSSIELQLRFQGKIAEGNILSISNHSKGYIHNLCITVYFLKEMAGVQIHVLFCTTYCTVEHICIWNVNINRNSLFVHQETCTIYVIDYLINIGRLMQYCIWSTGELINSRLFTFSPSEDFYRAA